MVRFRCRLRTVLLMALIMGTPWFQVALADLNDGLVAHYPFDGNANDASGNGNDGTVKGATLTDDRFGNTDSAYKFDGQDDYIDLGHVNTNISSQFSISAEIKAPQDRSAFRVVLSKGLKSRSHFEIYIEVDRISPYVPGEFRFYSPNLKGTGASGTVLGDFGSGKVVDDDTFHHLVVTYDGSTTMFYLDGVMVYKESTIGIYVDETAQLFIGRQTDTAGGKMSFKGVIDEVRIYNRALSEDEVQALYHNGDCKHATYSLKKRTITVPFVEMPVIDFLTGQPTGQVELWTNSLKQVSGTTNRFILVYKKVSQITDGSSSSCPATYAVETGTLSIPYLDIPIGIAVGNEKFENGINVFKSTMTWDPIGKSFVVQEVKKLSKSCAEIKANDSLASDGIYEIDPDGTGGNQPFEVYCDMTTDEGGWALVFRHDASDGYFSGVDEAANINQDNPGLDTKKYSILNQLDAFKRDGKFQFRINWPGFTKRNIWSQTSNPTENVDVAGYQGISVNSTSNHWGGLELGNGSHGPSNNGSSYLDGSVNHSNWFYAVGSSKGWGGAGGCYNGIPAADTAVGSNCGVQTVELWVK